MVLLETMANRARAIGRVGAVGILLLVLGGALALDVAFGSVNPSRNSTSGNSEDSVTAAMLWPNGTLTANVTLTLGQEIRLSVQVPSGSAPVSVHQVVNGQTYGSLDWNVTATHYDYVIDSGPADNTDLGVNTTHAVVVFADGSTVRSSNVTYTVVQ